MRAFDCTEINDLEWPLHTPLV